MQRVTVFTSVLFVLSLQEILKGFLSCHCKAGITLGLIKNLTSPTLSFLQVLFPSRPSHIHMSLILTLIQLKEQYLSKKNGEILPSAFGLTLIKLISVINNVPNFSVFAILTLSALPYIQLL